MMGEHLAGPQDDPKKPYKAIASAVIAALAVLIAQGQDIIPPFVMLILAAVVAGLTTYNVRNPTE